MEPLGHIVILPAAFVLDLLIGDPRALPHPVRWMGSAISATENAFRSLTSNRILGGLVFAVALILAVWLAAWGLVRTADAIHPLCGIAMQAVLIATAVSARSLWDAAGSVWKALDRGQLEQARQRVATIVGRDTARLEQSGVCRATVESVAENFVDGVVSPLFYAAIGGAPLALAYKMVNTLDSMVGYRTQRYLLFGRASARIDDAANYLPARLAVPVIAAAAQWLFKSGGSVLRMAVREGRHHSSPNSGLPEAAFSGALHVRLGGADTYRGVLVDKPVIGAVNPPPDPVHIPRACNLLLLSSAIWVAAAWGAQTLARFVI
jgi:adenosylcobinamide-phosphate synthase